LQAIFNLILYAMVRVLMVVDESAQRLSDRSKRAIDIGLLVYCAGVPLLMLIVAFSLDQLSLDLFVASTQLARQSSVCQVRLSQAVEIVIVYIPFAISGVFVTLISFFVMFKLRVIRYNIGSVAQKNKTAGDVALHLLIVRLTALGMATFVVLIVMIVSTGIYQQQLSLYGPAFNNFFVCQIVGYDCLHCPDLKDTADSLRPSPGILGTQLAATSSIVLLFGLFFGSQSASRLHREWLDGTLGQKWRRIVGKTGKANSQIETTVRSGDAGQLGTQVFSNEEVSVSGAEDKWAPHSSARVAGEGGA
jgi:hypothetical protein